MSNKEKSYILEQGGKSIRAIFKGWAERADAEALVRMGDSEVFTTLVAGPQNSSLDFFPLTVTFEEKYYAVRKILGSRFVRREGKPSDNAILVSRMIDRAIRPLFPDRVLREVQIVSTCFSFDEENDPDILGLIGASLVLTLSSLPWEGPIGAVRIAKVKEELILFPDYEQRNEAEFELVITGCKKDGEVVINMIECLAFEVPEKEILEALEFSIPFIKEQIAWQERIREEIGREKEAVKSTEEEDTNKEIREFVRKRFSELSLGSEREVYELQYQIFEEWKELKKDASAEELAELQKAFAKEMKEFVKELVFEKGTRIDGRKLDEIRPLSGSVGIIPRAHGSGFFVRGWTKVLSILTLGAPSEAQLIEGMEYQGKKRFFHHYNFPPYSTGEVKRIGPPSRREIGHGALVEKALLPVIPDEDEFPYTIRVVSEVLCSNGSTSMASVCASTLALMDGGVPIKNPVAGIAIGILTKDKDYRLLLDIQGPEDFFGEMDFKVTGTPEGITAIQLDVKIKGLTLQQIKEALELGKQARLQILKEVIEKTLPEPRERISPFAPKIYRMEIKPEKIGEVIGSKGATIKRIIDETGVEIDIDPSGLLYISGHTEESIARARELIKDIVKEIEVGQIFEGKIVKLVKSGALVQLTPRQAGLVPFRTVSRRLKVGEVVRVQVQEIDEMGRITLALLPRFHAREQ